MRTVVTPVVLIALALGGCVLTNGTVQSMRPTVIAFGDSHSIGYSGVARYDLRSAADYRHDDWDREGSDPSSPDLHLTYFYAMQAKYAYNDGTSAQLLQRMETMLNDRNFTVIVFNAGVHDLKYRRKLPLPVYGNNIEAAAQIAEQHASIVIWVDTMPIPKGLIYGDPSSDGENAVADKIAQQHGFYMLHMTDAQHQPGNIHYTAAGDADLGQQVADCVLLALAGNSSDRCHR